MNKLNISTRLNLGFAVIIAVFLLLAAVTSWRIEKVSQATARMALETELLELAEKWQGDVRQNSARSLAVGYSESGAMLDFFKDNMAETSRQTTVTQKAFLEKVKDEASRKLAENVGEVRKGWLATRDQVNALKAAGDAAGARALVQSKFVPVTDEYIKATQTLVDKLVENSKTAAKDVDVMFHQLYLLGALMLLAVIGFAVMVSWSHLTQHFARHGIGSGDRAAHWRRRPEPERTCQWQR